MSVVEDLAFPRDGWVTELVHQSLAEDVGPGDASTSIAVMPDTRARATIVARDYGVVAGLPLLKILYAQLSPEVSVEPLLDDGARVEPGTEVARLTGSAAALLTGERTALNFLQHLSGIATLTSRYVAAVAGTDCLILDTRKTVPGYRSLAKYAVRAGGGHNHRFGLYDRILLKDNHWAVAQGVVADLVARGRRNFPDLGIEIEVDDLAQFEQVLPLEVDWVLLDNFSPEDVVKAVRLRRATGPQCRTRLEASGNIDLDNVYLFAEAGADAVSIGRLTHSAPALDLSQELELQPESGKGVAS